MNEKFYLLEVFAGVDIILHGPFPTIEEQKKEAKCIYDSLNDEDSLFWLDQLSSGELNAGCYISGFFDK